MIPPQLRGSRLLEDDNDTNSNDSFLMLLTVIIVLISIFYILGAYQLLHGFLRRHCCGDPDGIGQETVLVHDGRVFNLNEHQRRAVLEAIFSETSKPATEDDFAKKKKKKRRKDERDEDLPIHVDIPGVSTTGTDDTASPSGSEGDLNLVREQSTVQEEEDEESLSDESTLDEEQDMCIRRSSPVQDEDEDAEGLLSVETLTFDTTDESDDRLTCCKTADEQDDDDNLPCTPTRSLGSSRVTPRTKNVVLSPCRSAPITPPVDVTPVRINLPGSKSSTPVSHGLKCPPLSQLALLDLHSIHDDDDVKRPLTLPPIRNSFVIPEHEEAKQEEEDDISMSDRLAETDLTATIPLARRESFNTVASEYTYDDESTVTGENVCAICIGGYKQGDMLIISKHCTHAFHKNCILEWLQGHDDCPICRVDMVTDSEMSQAATSLVGKTRMFLAVNSVQRQPAPISPNSMINPHLLLMTGAPMGRASSLVRQAARNAPTTPDTRNAPSAPAARGSLAGTVRRAARNASSS